MARLGVDADQDRSVAALGVLHLGGELERIDRHDTVIVVGSRYQRRRILRALLDVMQRGVFVEVARTAPRRRSSRTLRPSPSRW